MLKFKIEDVDAMAVEGKEVQPYFLAAFSHFTQYVNETYCPHFNLKLRQLLDLVVNEGTYYFVFNPNSVLEELCHLMDVQYYEELDDQSKYSYYVTRFATRLQELSCVRTEEELLSKFLTLYTIYREKKERIEESVNAYYTYARVKPARAAEELIKRRIYKSNINDYEYQELLNESLTFNFYTFIQKMVQELSLVVGNLPFILENLNTLAIDPSQIKEFDQEKIVAYINKQKGKRL